MVPPAQHRPTLIRGSTTHTTPRGRCTAQRSEIRPVGPVVTSWHGAAHGAADPVRCKCSGADKAGAASQPPKKKAKTRRASAGGKAKASASGLPPRVRASTCAAASPRATLRCGHVPPCVPAAETVRMSARPCLHALLSGGVREHEGATAAASTVSRRAGAARRSAAYARGDVRGAAPHRVLPSGPAAGLHGCRALPAIRRRGCSAAAEALVGAAGCAPAYLRPSACSAVRACRSDRVGMLAVWGFERQAHEWQISARRRSSGCCTRASTRCFSGRSSVPLYDSLLREHLRRGTVSQWSAYAFALCSGVGRCVHTRGQCVWRGFHGRALGGTRRLGLNGSECGRGHAGRR